MVCLRCHQVMDLEENLAPDMLMDSIFQNSGFRATTLQVQVTGFCPECQQAKREEIGKWLRDPKKLSERSAAGLRRKLDAKESGA